MSLTPYAAWTPMSDTREMPAVRRGRPLGEQPTEALYPLNPPATAPARRRRFISREDWTGAWQSASTVMGGLTIGLTTLATLAFTHHLGELLLVASTGGHL